MEVFIDHDADKNDDIRSELIHPRDVSFLLNGKRVVLTNVDPKMLLIDFLRSVETGLTGTKLSCGEGGCGACTVLLTQKDPVSNELIEGPINACLRPLCSVDGMAVTTTEGIGDHHSMNPIQERIVAYNGSQCGFCTPGFVMCMYGMLRANSNPSPEDIEGFFDGNLCRCTGFRPILDAMQSFAGDAAAITAAKGAPCPPQALGLPREFETGDGKCTWKRVISVAQALAAMRRPDGRMVRLVNGNTSVGIYKRPLDRTDIFLDISQVPELRRVFVDTGDRCLKVGGGVTYAILLGKLAELIPTLPSEQAHGLQVLATHVGRIAGHQVRSVGTVGGAVMLTLGHAHHGEPFPSDLFTVLATLDAKVTLRQPRSPEEDETYELCRLPPLADFPDGCLLTEITIPFTRKGDFVDTYKVARRLQNSHAIVNAGFLVRLDEEMKIRECRIVFGALQSIAWRATHTEEAIIGLPLDPNSLALAQAELAQEIEALDISVFGDGVSPDYRRRLANNLLYKFFVELCLTFLNGSVDPRFADAGSRYLRPVSSGKHGTIPAPYVAGAKDAHLFLLKQANLAGAGSEVQRQRTPTVIYDERKWIPVRRLSGRNEVVANRLAEALLNDDLTVAADVAAEPMVKLGAELQATGEAKYTQDILLPQRPLETQFVLSERSFAKFKHSKPIEELIDTIKREYPGVRAYITFGDIPNKGATDRPNTNFFNDGDPAYYDPVFANVYVTAVGQPIGLVLADTVRTAHAAALRLQDFIDYDTDGLHPAVMTMDEAERRKSYLQNGKHLETIERPSSDKAWLDSPAPENGRTYVNGTQTTGAQAHFYFETQSALAVPGEDDKITIYCSSQNQGSCQSRVASALGIPNAKVDSKAVRLGGGFGGKEVRAPYYAVAAAVAAQKTGKPVRVALDRNTDMRMVGKRHPFKGEFFVSADTDGRIEKIKFDFLANAGSSYDCTLPVTDLVLLSADSAYGTGTFRAGQRACLTNTLTNTAMRSFGVIQCTLIVEAAIEKLAYTLGISPETVRERNFYRDATLTDCDMTPYGQKLMDCRINQVWSDFKKIVDFDDRVAAVVEFNKKHRWRKRGISMVPIKYGVSYTFMASNQSSADVLVFGSDGTVLVKHGGMEMGQGIHTKIARLAADALGIDVNLVQIAGTDTFDVANAPSTGASTGTDLNGGAVQEACSVLRKRLEKFCTDNPLIPSIANWKTDWNKTWPAIVSAAFGARVSLSSQAFFMSPDLAALENGVLQPAKPDHPDPRIFYYFTYSVAASEVEIDVLTGEHTIVRADVVYDCGKTINAFLDYGQIEGGFVQGIGNVTSEELFYAEDGQLLANGTWNYKIPCTKSIPVEFNVYILDYIPTPGAKTPLDSHGIHSAKSTGEPPLVLSASVFFAIRHAIASARAETGSTDWFDLASPATVERIQSACAVGAEDLKVSSA